MWQKPTILGYLGWVRKLQELPGENENGSYKAVQSSSFSFLQFSLLRFQCNWCPQPKLIRPHTSFDIVGCHGGCLFFYVCHSPFWWILFGNCEGNDMFRTCPVLPALVSIAVTSLLWPGLSLPPNIGFNTSRQAFIVNVVSDCQSEIPQFPVSLFGCWLHVCAAQLPFSNFPLWKTSDGCLPCRDSTHRICWYCV